VKIERDYIQHVEVLALVFVDALHLRVKHGTGVYREAGVFEDVLREPHLDVMLHFPPVGTEGGILRIGFQPL
jgi:hypothetical protein